MNETLLTAYINAFVTSPALQDKIFSYQELGKVGLTQSNPQTEHVWVKEHGLNTMTECAVVRIAGMLNNQQRWDDASKDTAVTGNLTVWHYHGNSYARLTPCADATYKVLQGATVAGVGYIAFLARDYLNAPEHHDSPIIRDTYSILTIK